MVVVVLVWGWDVLYSLWLSHSNIVYRHANRKEKQQRMYICSVTHIDFLPMAKP